MFTKGFSVCFSPLNLLKAKEEGIITKLKNDDESILNKLLSMGVTQGLPITLERRFPSFVIKVGRTRLAIDDEIASSIYVRVTKSNR